MVSLKKYVPCKCGANNSFDFNSDMSVEDLTVSARCASCGASIAISVSSFLSPPSVSQPPASSTPSEPVVSREQLDRQAQENVEQAVRDLFR